MSADVKQLLGPYAKCPYTDEEREAVIREEIMRLAGQPPKVSDVPTFAEPRARDHEQEGGRR